MPLKRSRIRQVALKRKKSINTQGRKNKRLKKHFKSSHKYDVPEWFLKLPYTASDHGANAHQKRLWRLVSEFVRARDVKKYGVCVACGTRIANIRGGQAGHFKAWSVCHGMFKYNVDNLALICAGCNRFGDDASGHAFGVEMNKRHGEGHTDWIHAENERHRGEKLDIPLLVAYAEEILAKKEAL